MDFENDTSVFKSWFCHLQAVILAKLVNILKPWFSFYKSKTMYVKGNDILLCTQKKMCGYSCSFVRGYELLYSSTLKLIFAPGRANGTMHGYQAALSLEHDADGFHSLSVGYVSATLTNLLHLSTTSHLLVPVGN